MLLQLIAYRFSSDDHNFYHVLGFVLTAQLRFVC